MTSRSFLVSGLSALAACALLTGAAEAAGDPVKIGVIADMNGVYSTNGGRGAVVAAQLAVDEVGGTVLGRPIEIVSADYQGKVDNAASIARRWFDTEQVQMIIESTDSASAIAMQYIGAERKRVTMAAGAAASVLTNKECSRYGIHYVYDTYALASGTARAVVRSGGRTWFFITVDGAFGASLQADASKVVAAEGGKVLGSVKHPPATGDFASYLLQAQSSGAEIVAFANSGSDLSNSIKQAVEFGIGSRTQQIVSLLAYNTDVKSIGLDKIAGMRLTTAYDWGFDDQTAALGRKFQDRYGAPPTMNQAGIYSGVLSYLTAVKETGEVDADKVMAKLKSMTINDAVIRNGHIRADGLNVHDMYLVEAKKPSESTGPWDVVKRVATMTGPEAFQPESESTCPFLAK